MVIFSFLCLFCNCNRSARSLRAFVHQRVINDKDDR